MKRLLWAAAAMAAAAGCSSVTPDTYDPAIVVSPVSGPTTESGGQASFSVVLHSKPSGDVRLPFSVDVPAEAALLTTSITFTRINWDAPQQVIVQGVDDAFADGNKPFNVVFEPLVTADSKYKKLTLPQVPMTNIDDETAAVLVSNSSTTVSEAGDIAKLTLRLAAQPIDDVSVTVAVSDTSEATVFPATVLFPAATWDTPKQVTITGKNDAMADGNVAVTVSFGTVTSNDPAYQGLAVEPKTFLNLDDDIPAVLTTVVDGVSSEAGGTAVVNVRLGSQPSSNVTVPISVSNANEAMVSAPNLVFDSTNWNVAQPVTLTGLDDGVTDGHKPYQLVFGAAQTNDASYNGLVGSPVGLVNADDETASASVSPLLGVTSEVGGQVTITVVLNSQPTFDVTLPVHSGNVLEGKLDVTSLTFTAANWDVPQTFHVTGVRDILVDGHTNYSVVFDPAVSNDPVYAGYRAPAVNLTNLDSGTGPRALVFDDANGTFADDAAAAIGMEVVNVSDEASFDAEMDQGPYDLVIVEVSSLVLGSGAEARIASWVGNGNRLVASYGMLDTSPALLSALDVSATPYSGWRYVFNNPAAPYSHFKGLETLATVISGTTIVANSGNELVPGAGGVVTARLGSASGPGGIVVTHGGTVVVNGFSPDDAVSSDEDGDAKPDVRELYSNEIGRLFSPPRFDSASPFAIADNTIVDSSLNVFGLMPIKTARVSLHLNHTFDSDVDITLVAPDGTTVDVSTDNGSSGDNYGTGCADGERTELRDDATVPVTTGVAPFTGSFIPEQTFASRLAGKSPNGTWKLRVGDDASGDTGTFFCWSLFLEY